MSRILIVTAVRPETRAAIAALSQPRRVRSAAQPCWQGRAGANHVTLIQAGVGHEAARRAVTAAPDPCSVIVSLGFAGALVPGPGTGDFVLSRTVLWDEDGQLRRHEVARGLLDTVETALPPELRHAALRGALLSSPVVLATPAQKQQAARHYGAVAVEMEAAALAGYAADRGIDFLALRVILDPVDLSLASLPKNLGTSWAARARLVGMPATWPLLLLLRRHATAAGTTLRKIASAILPALVSG
jgi:nucleoside phosphorylase